MISAFRVAACSSICLSIFALVPLAQSQTYQGRELVKAELLADTNAVVPGKPFTVGLLLRMAQHWHTYWKFSGDAGIPTELKWKLPPGWKAGEIQWPIPLKTIDPGDIQTYGYQDEVLLMQEITPPARIDNSPLKLSADATWLVCEKICIPGNASLQLELPKSTTSASANTEIFARFRRLLPQNWPEPKVATANWTRAGSDLRLSVKSATLANYPRADFYPLPEGETVVGHPKVESRSANEVVFRVPIESASKDLSSIQGLIVFGQSLDGPDRAAWQTPASTIASASSAPSRGIFTFLFFGFLGGIILNLMPCVLPVISL
jgi:DsbC/DsbD-like thiol-disulfide interchange protein